MSRLDEAIRKAEQQSPHTRVVTAEERPTEASAGPFEAAWSFGQAESVLPRPPAPGPLDSATGRPTSEFGSPLAVFRGFRQGLSERLVLGPDAKPALVEQFRRLAATLHHAQVDRGMKTILVTSALASEGKSLTSTNLALTLGESYRRSVLLIDADLRRPALHDVFQVPNVSGLSDGLHADAEKKLSLVQITAGVTLLTAGRPDPDPMHVLTSDRMRRIIHEAADRFDWVIIDTPPVALLPDANLLVSMVDAALLVIRAGQTPYHLVLKAVDAIGRDRILGTVLNGAEETDVRYDYYQGYYKPLKPSLTG